MERYEPTTKNDCETCIHNKGVLECDMYGCEYEPTTKNDLGVDKTFYEQMVEYCNEHFLVLVEKDVWEDAKKALTTKNDLGVDCISKKHAIKTIQKYGVGCFDADEFSPEECERFVIAKLNELPSVTPQEPRWIPVNERLPEECTAVLVWCPERKNIYCAYLEEKQWWIFGAYWEKVTEEIAAWRSLSISPNSEVEE